MLITAHVSGTTDWKSLVGLGFAALAAFFAWRAVHWARQTVTDAEAASVAAADRHRIEMGERQKVAAAETLERQLRQLGVVIDMVLTVAVEIREVRLATDANWALPEHSPMPARLIALDAAVAVLNALGVPTPTKTTELARDGRHKSTSVGQLVSMTTDALYELEQLALDMGAGQVRTAADALS